MDLPYEGATPEQLRSPLVRELLGVHDMFRDQLAVMLQYIDELMAGRQRLSTTETVAQIRALVQAGTQYTQMLHLHHHIETTSMFPRLHEDGLETSVIDRLNAEHDEISGLIDRFGEAVQELAVIEPGVLDNDLKRLSDALRAHLAYEETHVCPFLAHFSHWPMH